MPQGLVLLLCFGPSDTAGQILLKAVFLFFAEHIIMMIILAGTQCQGKGYSCVAVFKVNFVQSAAVSPSRPVPLGQSSYILWSVSGAMALMSKALLLQWYGKS